MTFRILSMDGGGAWALIEARTLMRLHGANAKGHDVLKNFDLVAANSGGSLVQMNGSNATAEDTSPL